MGDINRQGEGTSFHDVHEHTCPNCKRSYSCNCHKQNGKTVLVCRDCETATYNPLIHGGRGEKEEA